MKFRPKEFFLPSVILHGCAFIGLIVMCWRVPTVKTPREKQFRVNLVKLSPAVSKPVSPAPRRAAKPKTVPKPKPEVKPKPKPETPKRKILVTPESVIAKQKKWREDRERKKREKKKQARKIITNVTPRVTWKPEPTVEPRKVVSRSTPLKSKDAFKESQRTLAELERSLKSDSTAIKRRMESYVRAPRSTADASDTQATIINDYFKRSILTAIDRVWAPPSARLVPRKAQCDIAFRLRRNGNVESVRVVRRSGFSVLDESAVAAVRQASFPAFPADLNKEFLDFDMSFECEPSE